MKVDFTKRLRNVSTDNAEAVKQILDHISSVQDDIEENNIEVKKAVDKINALKTYGGTVENG